jgi:hypothetical protein
MCYYPRAVLRVDILVDERLLTIALAAIIFVGTGASIGSVPS